MSHNYDYADFDTWSREFDEEQRQQKAERIKKREEQKAAMIKNKQDYKEEHGDYWYCECVDAWVSIECLRIPSLDKINTYGVVYGKFNLESPTQSMWETLVGSSEQITPYTIDEYHHKFCTKNDETDRWIYN